MIIFLFAFAGSADPSFTSGLIRNQDITAIRFMTAAKMKNEFAVPVSGTRNGMVTLLIKNGNIIAPKADPIFPSIFMVAETTPEFSPPISMHNDQLGAIVISTPKTAIENIRVNASAEFPGRSVIRTRPIADRINPAIAGILRERICPKRGYIKLANQPENHCAKVPNRRGMGA